MTIYRTTHNDNFTVYSNALVNSKLPSDCKNVLYHLLSKPKNWKLVKASIANALGLSKYAVQQAVIKLRKLGYLVFTRLKTGYGRWDVYEIPRSPNEAQTRVVKPSTALPMKETPSDLQNNDPNKIKNNYEPEPIPIPIEPENVVASIEIEQQPAPIAKTELVTIVDHLPLQDHEKRAATKTLANLSMTEIKAILAVFSRALTLPGSEIKNRIGYLVGLKKASLNGTLSPIEAQQAPPLHDRIALEKKRQQAENERIKQYTPQSFEQWQDMMFKQHGIRPERV